VPFSELRPTSTIGPGLVLKHTTGIVVGGEVVAGARLTLHQNVTLGDRRPYGGQPRLGDDVTLGAGACVLGPVTVGDRVVVAANAVVLDDVPSDSVVGGIPARVLRTTTAVTTRS
jgi:serine O-acetyltransferase